MKKSKTIRGWNPVPNEMRVHLRSLKGMKLAVWLCHRLHEGKEGTSYPSLKMLAAETGYYWKRICETRSALIKDGWLAKVGEVETAERDANGEYKVPVIKTLLPFGAAALPQNEEATMPQNKEATVPQFAVSAKRGTKAKPLFHEGQNPTLCCLEGKTVEAGNESTESNEASFHNDSHIKEEEPTGERYSQERTEKDWLQDWRGSIAEHPEKVSHLQDLGDEISTLLGDPEYDPLDVYRILQACENIGLRLGGPFPPGWVATLLKIFKSPRWKGCEKTVAELRFRIEAPRHDGKTLGEQFERVMVGKLRFHAERGEAKLEPKQSEDFQCPYCKVSFAKWEDKLYHEVECERKPISVECPECGSQTEMSKGRRDRADVLVCGKCGHKGKPEDFERNYLGGEVDMDDENEAPNVNQQRITISVEDE